MSDLIELLSDFLLLEPAQSDMDQCARVLRNMETQVQDLHCTITANSVAASHNDKCSTVNTSKFVQRTLTTNLVWDYHQNSTQYHEFRSIPQSTDFSCDSMCTASLQANHDLEVLEVNSNGNEVYSESRFGIMNSDNVVVNALSKGLLAPQLTDTASKRSAATSPYHISAKISSASSSISMGLSTIPFAIRGGTIQNKRLLPGASNRTSGANLVSDMAISTRSAGMLHSNPAIRRNATQMKRALSEASSGMAAGGLQKKAKGDMDPVGIPSPSHDFFH